jgi:hypothetical protein
MNVMLKTLSVSALLLVTAAFAMLSGSQQIARKGG